jgi:hypothetical protein
MGWECNKCSEEYGAQGKPCFYANQMANQKPVSCPMGQEEFEWEVSNRLTKLESDKARLKKINETMHYFSEDKIKKLELDNAELVECLKDILPVYYKSAFVKSIVAKALNKHTQDGKEK